MYTHGSYTHTYTHTYTHGLFIKEKRMKEKER